MARPDLGFYIVREQDFGRRCFPIDQRGRENEIANDQIEGRGCEERGIAAAHLRVEIFVDGEGPAGEQHARIPHIFGEAAARRERQGHGNHFGEDIGAGGVQVVGVFRVEGEEGDVVFARQLLENLEAANFAAGIGREQASGFDPQKLHSEYSLAPFEVLAR